MLRLKLKNYICENEATEPIETPEFELAISKAFIASLQSRGLLTPAQAQECTERLERLYSKHN